MSQLDSLIAALQYFNKIDPKMQVSTILVLLETANAHQKGSEIIVDQITKMIGIQNTAATRNVHYWADGHKQMPNGGHHFISVNIDLEDRRRRLLKPTETGDAFLKDVISVFSSKSALETNDPSDESLHSITSL